MTKFGNIIKGHKPVIIGFYRGVEDTSVHHTLKELDTKFSDKIKVVSIDMQKNKGLAEVLRLERSYYYLYYKGFKVTSYPADVKEEETFERLINVINKYL